MADFTTASAINSTLPLFQIPFRYQELETTTTAQSEKDIDTSTTPLTMWERFLSEAFERINSCMGTIPTRSEVDLLTEIQQETKTDIESSSQELSISDHLLSCIGAHPRFKQATLSEEIVSRFSQFDQVYSIYFLETPDIYQVNVVLNLESYCDELMDQLLDQESQIQTRYREKLFDFHYLPRIAGTYPISSEATLIWGKSMTISTNGRLDGSLETG
jgi:hypothetical protein